MRRKLQLMAAAALALLMLQRPGDAGDKDSGGVKVDKAKRTVTIDAKIAPRKLEYLKGEIYPLEVIACWPHPKGKKAHETVVTIDALPSAVHKGLVEIGLKPGTPVMGGEKEEPQGPEGKGYLEIAQASGEMKRVSIAKRMVPVGNSKPWPKCVKWRCNGSVMTKPDPNKKEEAYGADLTGTLISIFPVTNQTVMQTSLSMQYEKYMKLETNPKVVPKEGTVVKLVLEAPK